MEEPNHSPIISTKVELKNEFMKFPEAMEKVIEGEKVRREAWPEDEFGYLKDGWLSIHRKGKNFRWIVSDGDMLSDDWEVVSEKN